MENKILIVSDNVSSYIVRSLIESIKEAGYDANAVSPKVGELTGTVKQADLIIVYAGNNMGEYREAFVYLCDICIENDKKIGMIGYERDIAIIFELFPEKCIWRHFNRPFNQDAFIEELNSEMKLYAENELKKHILVIDDSGVMLRTVYDWLSEKYKVSMASSATMAISFLANQQVDLILLDYEMPLCSGAQFLEMIRAEVSTSNIPVIFLTAKHDKESVQKVLSLKPNGYLLKTLPKEKIIEAVDNFFKAQEAGK